MQPEVSLQFAHSQAACVHGVSACTTNGQNSFRAGEGASVFLVDEDGLGAKLGVTDLGDGAAASWPSCLDGDGLDGNKSYLDDGDGDFPQCKTAEDGACGAPPNCLDGLGDDDHPPWPREDDGLGVKPGNTDAGDGAGNNCSSSCNSTARQPRSCGFTEQ